jgi:hypothetical protein
MGYVILTSLGSITSILGLIYVLNKKGERSFLIYSLISLTVLLSILTGISWHSLNSVNLKYEALRSVRVKAGQLVDHWPIADQMGFETSGECRGIILSGISFLEANRYQFPETYLLATEVIKMLGITEQSDTFQNRQNLEEAAIAMVEMISSMR